MKNLGVWLDKEKAHIVMLENEKELFTTIKSEVENFHPSGGFGLGYKGSPQDAMAEDKYMEREKNQVKSYFNEVISKIKDADAIAIFGPAEIPEKLRKELQANFKDVSAKVKGVQKVDSMTDNQIKSLVRDFFN